MPACPACDTDISESAVFCPRCSAPTPWGTDVTHLMSTPMPPTKSRKTMAATSWLSSTDAIDHGRFQPGMIITSLGHSPGVDSAYSFVPANFLDYRRGAVRLAGVILLAALGVWALDSKHVADPNVEMTRFFTGQPLWAAGLLWLLYLALEPYVRRFWPATLVSWSRMMSGQWRDPLLGRDILFGIALGALVSVAGLASQYLTLRLGYSMTPGVPDLRLLLGTDVVIARTLNHVFNGVLNALFAVFGMVLLKMIFKRERLAVGIAIGLTMLLAVRGIFDGGAPPINGIAAMVIVTAIVLTVQKLGLVATVMLFLTNFMMSSAAVTLDSSKWFFGNSVLLIAIPAALAVYAFHASRGGEPLLGRRLLD